MRGVGGSPGVGCHNENVHRLADCGNGQLARLSSGFSEGWKMGSTSPLPNLPCLSHSVAPQPIVTYKGEESKGDFDSEAAFRTSPWLNNK